MTPRARMRTHDHSDALSRPVFDVGKNSCDGYTEHIGALCKPLVLFWPAGACHCPDTPSLPGAPSRAALPRFATNETFATLFEALAARFRSAEHATYNDPANGMYRAALIEGGKLDAVLFWGREGDVPPGAVLPKPGSLTLSTIARGAFCWQAEAGPPISIQALRSAPASE
jgi:hypothetical protein